MGDRSVSEPSRRAGGRSVSRTRSPPLCRERGRVVRGTCVRPASPAGQARAPRTSESLTVSWTSPRISSMSVAFFQAEPANSGTAASRSGVFPSTAANAAFASDIMRRLVPNVSAESSLPGIPRTQSSHSNSPVAPSDANRVNAIIVPDTDSQAMQNTGSQPQSLSPHEPISQSVSVDSTRY